MIILLYLVYCFQFWFITSLYFYRLLLYKEVSKTMILIRFCSCMLEIIFILKVYNFEICLILEVADGDTNWKIKYDKELVRWKISRLFFPLFSSFLKKRGKNERNSQLVFNHFFFPKKYSSVDIRFHFWCTFKRILKTIILVL